MILHRINEFKTPTAWYEYAFLYSTTSISFITLCFAILGRFSPLSGALAFILLTSSIYIYACIQRIRHQRAVDFFCQCIEHYNYSVLHRLAARVKEYEQEHRNLEQRLHFLKQQDSQQNQPNHITKDTQQPINL